MLRSLSVAIAIAVALGLAVFAFVGGPPPAMGAAPPGPPPSACGRTYQEAIESYAAIGIHEQAAYGGIEQGGAVEMMLMNEGMWVEGAQAAHVFGNSDVIIYVFTRDACVLAIVAWRREGPGLKGVPA